MSVEIALLHTSPKKKFMQKSYTVYRDTLVGYKNMCSANKQNADR